MKLEIVSGKTIKTTYESLGISEKRRLELEAHMTDVHNAYFDELRESAKKDIDSLAAFDGIEILRRYAEGVETQNELIFVTWHAGMKFAETKLWVEEHDPTQRIMKDLKDELKLR